MWKWVEVDCSAHGMSWQAGMAGLFRDRLLCDVTVIVGGSEFKAHACVLAAVSGYFRRLLVGASPIKKAATRISLNFEHATAAAFAAVLDCIYLGKMVVEEDSIVAVVHISNKLELLAVRSACIGHLVSHVQDSNMEQMLALGQELACTKLVDAAKAAIRKRSGYGSPNGEDQGPIAKFLSGRDRPASSPLTVMQCAQCMFGGLQQDRVTGVWADPSQKESYPNLVLLPTCASTFKVGARQLCDSSGGMQSYKGPPADKYVVNNSDKCCGACWLKIGCLVIAQADAEQNGPVPSSWTTVEEDQVAQLVVRFLSFHLSLTFQVS